LTENQSIRVGQIVGAFGLRGEVKVEPLTDFWQRFQKGSRLRLKGNWVTVEGFREHKNRPLLKLSGVDTIDAAEKLQWEYLEVTGDRPDLDTDEFYADDLEGLMVVTVEGQELGEVDEVLATPAHPILVIGDIMIPAVKEFVVIIDLEEERITVRLIPGMLPEAEESENED